MSAPIVLTNTLLKSLMTDAMVTRPAPANLDECHTPGIYLLQQGTLGMPTGHSPVGAILEVLKWDVNRTYQRITKGDGMIYRYYRSGSWQPWWKVTATTL